jgi:ABC-type polysaccharide/polyol phosphate transport system ATPase subunit
MYAKSYDGKVLLKDFSYTFIKGEKIGIIGSQWSWKIHLAQHDYGTCQTG